MKRLSILLMLAAAAFAQPRLTNANLETRAFSGWGVFSSQLAPAWFGYAVPIVPGEHRSCCHYSSNGNSWSGCSLEPNNRPVPGVSGPIRLEGSKDVHILLRVENGQVGKIRSFSGDCELDAGGLPVIWLTGVKSADSLSLLDSHRPNHKSVIAAISLHSGPEADAYLEKYVAPEQPESLRRDALFGVSLRGDRGVQTLLRLAKSDKSDRVRGQALFWLAQKAGRQAVPAIQDAMENDPELRVKEQAVFALSQLPKEEGVPLLIDVAKNNRNQQVRKKAMFWLGQSKDPRAVKFFEELLTR